MSAPAVSHHLRILKKSGIIISRREGKEVYYTLSDTPQQNYYIVLLMRYLKYPVRQINNLIPYPTEV